MRKFIHSDFEIDLSVLQVTDTAENPWFSGNFFAKYSYPFDIPLTNEMDALLGLISHHNSSDFKTLFEGIYVHGNTMEKAVLEIEEQEQGLSATLRYGFDEFPNFKKRLAELPLQVLAVDNIYTHAAGIIAQTWPAVNYNFPQIHTDKYDPENDDTWMAFEKIINNYRNGAFLVNEIDAQDQIFNRNIIQPLPYVLHILMAGVEDAGYTLHGAVLEHPEIKKMLLYAAIDYYTSLLEEPLTIQMLAVDYDDLVGSEPVYQLEMERELVIPNPGRYRITGTGLIRRWYQGFQSTFKIYYRDSLIHQTSYSFSSSYDAPFPVYNFTLDFVFDTEADLDPHLLTFEFECGYGEEDILLQAEVHLISLFNNAGTLQPSIVNENVVNLKRAVPDMLFGDLFKAILAMYNMDIDIRGTEVWVNHIQDEVAVRPIIDLSAFEVKFPKRSYNKGNSYHMKYQDANSEEYTYTEVFQSINGVSTADFKTDEQTTPITINALPLPLKQRFDVTTAFALQQESSKPYFVLYNGLQAGLNTAQDPSRLLIPYLHQNYHQAWLSSLINSINYLWLLDANDMQIYGLTNKSRVHAYNNIHLVKVLQKKEVKPGEYEIELETKLLL